MSNKIAQFFPKSVQLKLTELNQKLNAFRPYNLGGLALNQLTSNKGYSVKRNIAYGLKARQRLDLYVCQAPANKPLVIFVHGGAWSRGSKDDYKFLGESLTRAGYNLAVINYHLAPEHIFPHYVTDLADSIQYLIKSADKYGICADQIALIGHSAGAFNVMSLIYHPSFIDFEGRDRIKALIGLAGPYHFNYLGDHLSEHAFDKAVNFKAVMPYYFVEKNNIQHYIFLADQDTLVKDHNSEEMHQALLAVENHSQLIRVPRTGHVSIMATTATLFDRLFKTRSLILKVLEESFK
ncbi:alpha/beta hydrolase [Acinetobacter sp. YH12239]|uniref:alpha/beta hydrolase n=1 Tax=Acinetobacter sp. YH12239 TaxID=2601166 RepID=UPI0015D2282E|nr:alpha/beta hydrolase [Acinetobacter sp. YH12239]